MIAMFGVVRRVMMAVLLSEVSLYQKNTKMKK